MKFALVLLCTSAAIADLSESWLSRRSDLDDLPFQLQKRMHREYFRNRAGEGLKIFSGRGRFGDPAGNSGNSPGPDSPKKEGDTEAQGKILGPGSVRTFRAKNQHLEHPERAEVALHGSRANIDTHDRNWSGAVAESEGLPPAGSMKQSPLLHPAKVVGTGRSGHVTVAAPPRGGYAQLKKVVNGQVLRNDRIPPGESAEDYHSGKPSERVTYTGSASRGGKAVVIVSNGSSAPLGGASPGQPSSRVASLLTLGGNNPSRNARNSPTEGLSASRRS